MGEEQETEYDEKKTEPGEKKKVTKVPNDGIIYGMDEEALKTLK